VVTDGYRLGVDFGTSSTVAVLAGPGGRVRPLLFDGSELLPSAVCRSASGELLVGRDALHEARANPGGFEPHPKRAIDDGTVLLGDAEIPVAELIAAVLRRVAAEAHRVAGAPVTAATLTCPAGWGPRRRAVLSAAAAAAGLDPPALVAEPVAAACYFAEVAAVPAPTGACLLLYDFGAGTFDASVVRRTAGGFEVLAERGLPDTGGLDIDAAVIGHLGTVYAGRDPLAWRRLTQPTTPEDRRSALPFRHDVRTGKELLSRSPSTLIHVPLFGDDAPLGRAELERLARPILDRTIRTTRAALDDAGVRPDEVAGLFLVGGSSRLPLAATLLHQQLGIVPTVMERPELVVAEGSLHATPTATTPAVHTPSPPEPEPEPEPEPVRAPTPPPPARRTRRTATLVGLALLLAAAAVGLRLALRPDGGDDPNQHQSAGPSGERPVALLGPPDFTGYCAANGRGTATLVASNAYGWRCTADPDNGLVAGTVCSWTYHIENATDRADNFADAHSWQCWRANHTLGPLDLDAYCRGVGRGTATNPAGRDGNRWSCTDTPTEAIDPQAGCEMQYAARPPLSRFNDFYDPHAWECWG
jgi:hypothetical protein